MCEFLVVIIVSSTYQKKKTIIEKTTTVTMLSKTQTQLAELREVVIPRVNV